MSLFPSLDNLPDKQEEKITGSLNLTFSTVEYLYETFLNGLDGVLTNEQIEYEIINYYDKYCDYDNFQSESTRRIFQEIWKNERFLILFKQSLPYIGKRLNKYHNKVICKIAYDYYATYNDETRNAAVTMLLFQIVEEINTNLILPLTTIMDKQSALFIVMSRFSSFELDECVKRVNDSIINLGYDFTVNQIIYIYSKLYSDGFGQPFNHIMTQVYESNDLSNQQCTIYNRINVALLIILNSMTTSDIEKVLTGYEIFLSIHPELKTRFDIKKAATIDYSRLREVLLKYF